MAAYFIGVDVGTGSARAGLFDETGKLLKSSTEPIKIWNPQPHYYEQSSEDIWDSCCKVVKNVSGHVDASLIKGVGFDATCSLVVLGTDDKPLTVSPTGKNEQNIIMWMDHRASNETDFINATKHSAFKFVGGKVSIEMQLPKLLWLKKNLPDTWRHSKAFFDLPDFLTWKATGCDSRSQCSVVCKWNYVVDKTGQVLGWPKDLFQQIGLGDLLESNSSLIGSDVKVPGGFQGTGLSAIAAKELGLRTGTPVGVSLIDAYAGALGLLACHADSPLNQRLALICGTSACHMAVVPRPAFVEGVWGPYSDVLLPGMWLLEGGQSAVGKLLDHIIETHPSYPSLKARLGGSMFIPQELGRILHSLAQRQNHSVSRLTQDLHIWPDFHGNRSPLADPNLKGMICGLSLDSSEDNLALLYLATVQALCYGTRHIISALLERNVTVSCLPICGGLTKSDLFVTTMADATGLPIIIPHELESVLLGSAMLGASASGLFQSLTEAMAAMGGSGKIVMPNSNEKTFHERKYRVFLKMLGDQTQYNIIMNED